MSKMRKLVIAAVALLTIGGIAAVAAGRHHDGRHRGDTLGFDADGFGADGRGRGERPRWFARGPLSAEETDARIRERFARLDKNGDGVIDIAEIEASLAQRAASWRDRIGQDQSERGRAPTPGAELSRRFDTNADGKVSQDEFLAGIKKRFSEMDLNNDGRFSDDDLPPMMRGRGAIAKMAAGDVGSGRGHGGERAMRFGWLRGVEVKDGAITLEAVLAKATAEFARLDYNKDGVVDTADFDLMRKDMADYRVKRFLHMFGADKDGKITKAQFTTVAKERMARMVLQGTEARRRGRSERSGEPRQDGGPHYGTPGGPPGGPPGDNGPRN
jgi:Ca2+-binding EF-hand superfamily protein